MSAAEASGDLHAGRLIEAIRRRMPSARFVGVAGPHMAAAGCEVLADLTPKASMLGWPILRLGYYIRKIMRIQKLIRRLRPDIHVPVDSPAMNWHLMKAAKKVGTPVVYYIAPQVWAWASWRVKKLAKLTDRVACILPFEQEYLRSRGVQATYVGHPLFDTLGQRCQSEPDTLHAWWTGKWRVALLPGSRRDEIKSHTPALLDVAEAIRRRWPGSICTITARDEKTAEIIRKLCGETTVEIAVTRTREVLAESHFAVAVSGTVTLEAAYFGVPMVIFYRVNRLAYGLGRWLVHTPHLSLVNILSRRRIVPELMPWHGGTKELVRVVMELLSDVGYLVQVRRELTELVKPLRVEPPQTASDNAAELICKLLDGRDR